MKEAKFTKNLISRDEAFAICPNYVAMVEKAARTSDGVSIDFRSLALLKGDGEFLANLNNAHRGQEAITVMEQDGSPIFLRVKVTSVRFRPGTFKGQEMGAVRVPI